MRKTRIPFNRELMIEGMKKKGLSVNTLARKIGSNPRSVEQWLKGEASPWIKSVRIKLAHELGVDYHELFSWPPRKKKVVTIPEPIKLTEATPEVEIDEDTKKEIISAVIDAKIAVADVFHNALALSELDIRSDNINAIIHDLNSAIRRAKSLKTKPKTLSDLVKEGP